MTDWSFGSVAAVIVLCLVAASMAARRGSRDRMASKNQKPDMKTLLAVAMMVSLGAAAPSTGPARQAMAKVVARIQTADYEGDRKALLSWAPLLNPTNFAISPME